MARVPNIYEQVFASGDAMTGVPYTGLSAVQSADGHVYRQTKGGAGVIDGGLLPSGLKFPDDASGHSANENYMKVVSIYVFASTATSIKLILVDTDGFEHTVRSSTTDTLVDDLLSDLFLLPGWSMKVTSDAIGVAGAKIVCATELWFHPAPFAI